MYKYKIDEDLARHVFNNGYPVLLEIKPHGEYYIISHDEYVDGSLVEYFNDEVTKIKERYSCEISDFDFWSAT